MRNFLSLLLVISTISGIVFGWSEFVAFMKEADIPVINEVKYRQLETGMTLEQVIDVAGKKPKLLSERDIRKASYQVYVYKERFHLFKREAKIYLHFVSGRLIVVSLERQVLS
ncbi:hypothetical protein [Cohnella sp. JJ-181]|uniref:hypothetical protein n=1 Tax=Cohnella rhizoplanae TaxID=2974897 RepID=UPI0022FF7651|nr:hypothetical protein [Cohnella sp. JJ-181]CAI6087679.1 hypothetical protein COHCIP112018_05645 [Cohnella sp. JJ-181]